jgi:hypothetical protein
MVTIGCLGVMAFRATRACAEDHSAAEESVVVATVGGEPVYFSEVQRLLGKVRHGQEVNPAAVPMLQAQVLSEIVDRRLVLAYAKRTQSGPTAAEIDEALAKLAAKLKVQGGSVEGFLKQRSISQADLRRQIIWNLAWPKYLARYVNDTRLESYFKAHRREFDGTEVSVSHILLRKAEGGRRKAEAQVPNPSPPVPGPSSLAPGPSPLADLLRRAEAIRREITSGKLSFAAAAQKYSAGPSAREGGRLGLIARRGAMVESFSRAAFALQPGQVSEPVVTPFGVHLIRCDEIKPGNKPWTEVREQLEKALARELLDRLARYEERFTPVEFTGKAPYLKPGTRELVLP